MGLKNLPQCLGTSEPIERTYLDDQEWDNIQILWNDGMKIHWIIFLKCITIVTEIP